MKILQTNLFFNYPRLNRPQNVMPQAKVQVDEFCHADSKSIRANFMPSFGLSPKDILYKQNILRDIGLGLSEIKLLEAIVGPDEFLKVAKALDTGDLFNKAYLNTTENIDSHNLMANFHMHTIHSDGQMSIEEVLNQAVNYAENMHNPPYYFAITDHNTVEGCKEAVKLIKDNPQKYSKVRLVVGCEFSLKRGHTIGFCLNPFDKEFEKYYQKPRKHQSHDLKFFSFQDRDFYHYANKNNVIGIAAHPIFYFVKDFKKRAPVENLTEKVRLYFRNFKQSMANAGFEGYYQAYNGKFNNPIYKELFLNIGKEEGLISTGGNDSHGKNIFSIAKT